MSDDLVTQCPECATSFHVTETQLAAARGAVRCGACLTVFSAVDHMLDETLDETLDDVAEVVDDEDAILYERPDEGLDEDLDEGLDARLDAALADLDALGEDDASIELNGVAVDEGDVDDDEVGDELVVVPELDSLMDEGLEPLSARPDLMIATDPTELVGSAVGTDPARNFKWIVGAFGLLVALALQVAWSDRDELSLNPGLRPAYQAGCDLLGCDIPNVEDKAALRTRDLIIRTHPVISRALMVDAIIVNEAATRQPFPPLELRFANIQDVLVAARTFAPTEYLRGELTGLKFIPGNTEVRISLEIVDPGPEATNYSLEIR